MFAIDKIIRMRQYDLIIIGAGPIGLTVGIEAKKAGLDYLIIEKGMLVNTVFRFPTNMTFFSSSKLLEIGDVPFIAHGDKPTRREALEYFRRVQETWDLNIHYYERVENVDKNRDNLFEVVSKNNTYISRNVVVATGFYDFPHLMNIPGENLPKVKHYYDEPHPYVGQKVAVVGAANSGCDVALELFHKGAEVTMVIREGEISDRVKYWIKPNIENRIKEGSIKAYFLSTVKEIREDEIVVHTPGGEITFENDFVLAMTGYEPDFNFLKKIGIEWEKEGDQMLIYDEHTHLSNITGIYLAGVVCGGMKTNKFFIENAKDHADKIVGHILEKTS
jgi:thioredoxin reductase (NADPH)